MVPLIRTLMQLVAASVLLTGSGCALPTKAPPRAPFPNVQTELSKEELAGLLQQFEDTFEATIREAAEQIVALQPDRRSRRLALLWQMRLIPMARDTLNQDDAVHSLLDSWALCVRMGDYFEQGDGRELFGANQHIAQAAAHRAIHDIEDIAARILPRDSLDRARPAIEDLARQFPLRGEFSGSTVRTALQRPQRDPDIIASILTVPMAPFRAFDGIDRGAAAIQGFTAVAARMTDTVNDLPETVRLQTKLLLLEIEELESVQATLTSLGELARSSARISSVAERLPEDLRREFGRAAEDLEQRQARLKETLREAREVVVRTNDALERVEAAAASVERTATHTAAAGDAWTGTFRAITEMVASFRVSNDPESGESSPASATPLSTGPPPDALHVGPPVPADPRRRGFDVNEYTQAAQALDRAALQIQDLTRELRQLAGSSELATSLTEVEARAHSLVERSHTSAAAIVDRLAWRGVLIVVLVFALLLGYTVLTRFLPPRSSPVRSRP